MTGPNQVGSTSIRLELIIQPTAINEQIEYPGWMFPIPARFDVAVVDGDKGRARCRCEVSRYPALNTGGAECDAMQGVSDRWKMERRTVPSMLKRHTTAG